MPRPRKLRRIQQMPHHRLFIPENWQGQQEMILKLEELEALRLKDMENLNQEECAEKMNVSRQTLQLILDEARKKVTEALVNGKAIRVEGGNYTLNICEFKCNGCGKRYKQAYEKVNRTCSHCGSKQTKCLEEDTFCDKVCKEEKEDE